MEQQEIKVALGTQAKDEMLSDAEFNVLHTKYKSLVLSICRKCNEHFYKDISQGVWLKVLRKWKYYRTRTDVPDEAMIRQITKTACIDFSKNRHNIAKVDVSEYKGQIPYYDTGFEDKDFLNKLHKLIIILYKNEPKRTIAIAKFIGGQNIAEIMEQLRLIGFKLPRNTIYAYTSEIKRTIVKYAKRKLPGAKHSTKLISQWDYDDVETDTRKV